MESEIRHGAKIGRFVVTGELGAGGMGVVYAAHDPELDRRVALKVLRAAAATDEERVRMLREGQAMARVTHPNVITVYEVGTEGTLVFLAQELLDAGTLGQWLAQPHPQAEILEKFAAAGRGLAAAHAAGLVHRDFKPDNVLLGKDGRVRVSDFGLARALGPADGDLAAETRANVARAQLDLSRGPMSPLTRTGAVMGTPMFMAPEQHNGERADARSDQFAFCVALYHALYGAYPYAGKTAVALADAVIDGRMERAPSGNRVPARLRGILLRGLSTKPAARYPTMDALLADLTRPPARGMRNALIAIGALALVGGAVIGGYALRDRSGPPKKPFDPKTLTGKRGVEWMTTAIDRGQLDDAIEKYDMAGTLAQDSGETTHASIAASSGALVLALRGHLDAARAHLKDAMASRGADPTAIAYTDLAAAAIAEASGDADTSRAARCATELAAPAPELAAICLELRGNVATARGDVAAARKAYGDGLALAKRTSLQLALAGLELDAGNADAAIAKVTALQAEAADQNTAVPDAAWILLARAHLAQAASRKAVDDLDHLRIDAIEAFELRIAAHVVHAEAYALLGDDGATELEAADAEAQKQGFPALVFAARLAQLEILYATSAPEAADTQRVLVADARSHGYLRIARLAETIAQR